MDVKYPEIGVKLIGINGNAFVIMGAVATALERNGVNEEEITEYREESMAGDYNNLLRVAMCWVSVT